MKEIVFTRRFERDFRRLKKRLSPHVLDYETLEYVFELLQRGTSLAGQHLQQLGRPQLQAPFRGLRLPGVARADTKP